MSPVSEAQRNTWVAEELEKVAKRGSIKKYARKGWFTRLFARVARRKRRTR